MKEPCWVPESAVIAIQEKLIAEQGGVAGIRDSELLSASLARPKHLFAYSDSVTLFDLAAVYVYGLAKKYAFIDGNKRIALVIIDVFLRLNGYELVASEAEAVIKINNLVAGLEEQDSIAAWIAANAQELDLE
jgi:death-on-curing protein